MDWMGIRMWDGLIGMDKLDQDDRQDMDRGQD